MVAALYALICLIWGSTWLAIKVSLVGVPPFLGAGLRFLLATTMVGLALGLRRKPTHSRQLATTPQRVSKRFSATIQCELKPFDSAPNEVYLEFNFELVRLQ